MKINLSSRSHMLASSLISNGREGADTGAVLSAPAVPKDTFGADWAAFVPLEGSDKFELGDGEGCVAPGIAVESDEIDTAQAIPGSSCSDGTVMR
jgi:hypothetical protein